MHRVLLALCCFISVGATFASPERCGGRGQHSCITPRSACRQGRCVCQEPYLWGDPYFNCYRKNFVAAELKNDPYLTTFSKESVPFPFPCRFLFAHVEQQLKDRRKNVIGSCEFKIHAHNAKSRGKFFAHGFDVAARLNYTDGRVIELSSRVYGQARNNHYKFEYRGTSLYRPDGPWQRNADVSFRDEDNHVEILLFEDEENSRAVFQIDACGLKISLVPYDRLNPHDQISVPGISVDVNCANKPKWLSGERVMALAPVRDGGPRIADLDIPGLNNEHKMLSRAFTNLAVQNQPLNDNAKCGITSSSISRCSPSALEDAMANCYWILRQPRFIHCYDNSTTGKKILLLLAKCVDIWCHLGSCARVQRMIRTKGCDKVKDITELAKFQNSRDCRL